MENFKVFSVNKSVYAVNDAVAERTRRQLKADKTFMINLMASPGAGKTTLLLRTIKELGGRYKIGVMEADIASTVDAQKTADSGVRSIQVHTGGECAMNADMTAQAIEEFGAADLDLLVLENVGNLVCPAETDTGASKNVALLSYPEGDDKPLKYPLMFKVCDAVIISKIDTADYFEFNNDAVVERIHACNPNAEVIFLSAKTGEGFNGWIDWLNRSINEWIK